MLWTVTPVSFLRPSVIVLGKEKSGTTAIAALLAQKTGQKATLDIPSLWGQTERELYAGKKSFNKYVRRNKEAFAGGIVKEPGLTFLYPEVSACFPNAQIVMITRDPRDNIRSVLNRLDLPGDQCSLDEDTFQRLPPTWQVVIDSSWLGIQADSYIEMAAKRWNRAVEVYLRHAEEMHLVRYEDFVAGKIEYISRLCMRLGIDERNDISDCVDDQYQPKGNRSISWNNFYDSKNLRRIEQTCHDRMKDLGYI